MNVVNILKRFACLIVGFMAAYALYIIGLILEPFNYNFSGFDGLIALFIQLVMAGLLSAVFVGLAIAVGLILKIPGLREWWHSTRFWPVSLLGLGVFLLAFGYPLGFTSIVTQPQTGAQIKIIDPTMALSACFAIIFAIVNWPLRSRNNT
jgi:hypothetical protein